MPYNPDIHHRRTIRLKEYDYSQVGAYYFTIVTQNRECLFGEIKNAEFILNAAGKMLEEQWDNLPKRFETVVLDEFIVMPNHVHGILVITNEPRRGDGLPSPSTVTPRRGDGLSSPSLPGQAQGIAPPTNATLGRILGAWKSIVTNEYIIGVREKGWRSFDGKLYQLAASIQSAP
jgi:hypothetical protein